MNMRETVTLGFLLFFVFWIGLNPKPVLNVMDKSVEHLVAHVDEAKKHAHLHGHGSHGDAEKNHEQNDHAPSGHDAQDKHDSHKGDDQHDDQKNMKIKACHTRLFELEKNKTRRLVLN